MSTVPHLVPASTARPTIAQSLAKALAHIRFAESIAEADWKLGEKLPVFRRMTEGLLRKQQRWDGRC